MSFSARANVAFAWLGGLIGGLLAIALVMAAVEPGASNRPLLALTALVLAGFSIIALRAAWRGPRSAASDERVFSDAMIESLPGVLYFYTEHGRFLRWNRNLERATGCSRDDIARMHPLDLIPASERARVQAEIAAVFDTGESFVQSSLVHKDGSSTPHFFTGRRLVLNGVPCLVGVGLDISERERVQSRLRSSEASLARAQRIAHVGSWELDIARGELAWSDEIFRIFGSSPGAETVSYEHFVAHVHPDDREPLHAAQGRALRGEEPLNIEHRIVRPDGEVRWVHEVAELHLDARAQPDRLTGTVLDITERKLAQLQLEEAKASLEQTVAERTAQLQAALVEAESADRVKSAFLATMSHELRTPLNSILGFTGILLQSLAGPLNPEQHKQLGMVRGSARHLLELINDVLDLSKIEAQQLQVHRDPFDLAAAVDRIVASVAPQAATRGLTLSASLPPGPLDMLGDRRRVEQVLLNLLSNAIKFTEQGGVKLTVETMPRADAPTEATGPCAVRIRVTDTGIGIAPDVLPTLFRPFQQVDTGLTRTHEGTGLGLAICSRLVELMGGTINVESNLGVGTTVTVIFPENVADSPCNQKPPSC